MKKPTNYDFAGWATKANIKCSDNRTIMENAFAEQDGSKVPLVWNHNHNSNENVLGHAILENRKEGVYTYCYFNDTELAQMAKQQVQHGDITALSIYANQLKQDNALNVIHGKIREVSLVLAGANMGAYIDTVVAHSDTNDEEAIIYHPYGEDEFDLYHSEEGEEIQMEELNLEHAEEKEVEQESEKTVQEIYDSMTDEQKDVVNYLVGVAVENAKAEVQHSDENNDTQGENNMKNNVFEGSTETTVTAELMHGACKEIIDSARKNGGSVKDAFENYIDNCQDEALAHSVTDIGKLFPEVKPVSNVPETIHDNDEWIAKVMGGVKHTPFSRVKSTAIDITGENARALGYVKGDQKVAEVVAAIKRTTDPQTVYKLQKIDRDDYLDITDFDIMAWLKNEMRYKLDEEIARAILIGDGRSSDSDYKIDPTHIRPILGDSNVYTIAKALVRNSGDTNEEYAKTLIENIIRARKEWKGSGKPSLFCGEDYLTDMLLLKDVNGRYIYENVEQLATKLRVKEIVTAPILDNVVRTSEGYDYTLNAILVNLADYNVGADKGGNVSMFDDFDINYNKMEYLIETRCSGALVKPYSAIVFEEKTTHVEG